VRAEGVGQLEQPPHCEALVADLVGDLDAVLLVADEEQLGAVVVHDGLAADVLGGQLGHLDGGDPVERHGDLPGGGQCDDRGSASRRTGDYGPARAGSRPTARSGSAGRCFAHAGTSGPPGRDVRAVARINRPGGLSAPGLPACRAGSVGRILR
jgi:hypothetical protein